MSQLRQGLWLFFLTLVATITHGLGNEAAAQACYLPGNIANSSADEIAECTKLILKKDRSKRSLIHRDAPCTNIYEALLEESALTRNPQQQKSDYFCEAVQKWHEKVYVGRPFWSACTSEQHSRGRAFFYDIPLQACLSGYKSYMDRYGDGVDFESCASTNAALNDARRFATLERPHKLKDIDVGCGELSEALDRIFKNSAPSWTICTAYPYSDDYRMAHFQQCMGTTLASITDCDTALQLYEEKLKVAYKGQLPNYFERLSCERVSPLLATPKAEDEPEKEGAEYSDVAAPSSANYDNTERTSNVAGSLLALALIFAGQVMFQMLVGPQILRDENGAITVISPQGIRAVARFCAAPVSIFLSIAFWIVIFVDLIGVSFSAFVAWYLAIGLIFQLLIISVLIRKGIKGLLLSISILLGWSTTLSCFGIYNELFMATGETPIILEYFQDLIVALQSERFSDYSSLKIYLLGLLFGYAVALATVLLATNDEYFNKNKTHREGAFMILRLLLGFFGLTNLL